MALSPSASPTQKSVTMFIPDDGVAQSVAIATEAATAHMTIAVTHVAKGLAQVSCLT